MTAFKAVMPLLATGILVVGCNDSPSDAGLTGTSGLDPATVVSTTEPVVVIGVGTVVGEATITRNANGATANVHTTGLTLGNVYSLWWVVFGNPEECTGPCDATDLLDPDVNGGAAQVGAHVVGGSGQAAYGARLNLGDPIPTGNTLGNTFDDVLGSEIHLVIRNHGPALTGQQQAEQLSEFNGGCPPNTCANAQVSMHPAP